MSWETRFLGHICSLLHLCHLSALFFFLHLCLSAVTLWCHRTDAEIISQSWPKQISPSFPPCSATKKALYSLTPGAAWWVPWSHRRDVYLVQKLTGYLLTSGDNKHQSEPGYRGGVRKHVLHPEWILHRKLWPIHLGISQQLCRSHQRSGDCCGSSSTKRKDAAQVCLSRHQCINLLSRQDWISARPSGCFSLIRAPSTWNGQTLKDLGMLPLYLTSNFYDNFDRVGET